MYTFFVFENVVYVKTDKSPAFLCHNRFQFTHFGLFNIYFRVPECHQTFFLYAGQCFTGCPEKTFMSQTFAPPPVKLKPKQTVKLRDNSASKSSSLKKRKKKRKRMEDVTVVRNIMKPEPPKICLDCHYSCLTCSGPHDFQCLSCPPDAEIFNSSAKESFCYPSRIYPQISNATWFFRLYIVFFIIISLLLGVMLYFLLSCIFKKVGCCNKKSENSSLSSVSYNRLDNRETNVVREIHQAIFDRTDSESESDQEEIPA